MRTDLEPERNFEGDASLYNAFASACQEQFLHDAVSGDAAAVAGELQTLRRLTHDLRSALLLLGNIGASELALEVEQSTAGGDLNAARYGWYRLRRVLAHTR